MECKRFLSFPVISAFCLLGFVYYVTIFVFLDDWLGLQSSAGSLNALIFTFLASLTLFSFLVCVLTDPGDVPSSFSPDVEAHEVSDQEPNKTDLQLRRCDKCSAYKPRRAHHCRSCKRCILKMDHHCMWINNCVGLRNYKAFIILVFYATAACIYSSVLMISSTLQKDRESETIVEHTPFKTSYIVGGVIVIGMSFTLGTLLGWHIYLVIHNMTTIEHYESKRAAWLAKKSGQTYHHPFDVGAYKNLALVLGPNMLKWLCPTAISHIKDGITFPTIRDSS